MKRTGRQKIKDETKYPYIESIKIVKPFFWKICCGCQDEFKKEDIYKVKMQRPARLLGPETKRGWSYAVMTFTYYVCKECCSEPGAIKFFLEEKYGQRTFAEYIKHSWPRPNSTKGSLPKTMTG